MEDKNRFPASLREAVRNNHPSGEQIVQISKLILLEEYSDDEYDEDFFSTFNIILDDHRDGVGYDEIERVYESSFSNAVDRFRRYFSI